MNLKELAKIIRGNVIFIITLTVLGAFTALMAAPYFKSGYTLQETVFIKIEKADATDRAIDSQSLTDTVVAYLESADFQRSQEIGGATTEVEKVAPQVIAITTISPSPETTVQVHQALISNFNSRSQSLINDAKIEIVATGKTESPINKIIDTKVLAIFGALIGLALSAIVISISRYFEH